MAEHRFLLNENLQINTTIDLSKADLHHAHTLRLKPKQIVYIVDGQGTEFKGEVININKQQGRVRLIATTNRQSESNLNIILYQGLTKGSKLDLVIQKCTELGVKKIIPVISNYSQIKVQGQQEHKQERWQEIARQAARQSGRLKVPQVVAPHSFNASLDNCLEKELTIIFHNLAEDQSMSWEQLTELYRILKTDSERMFPIPRINLFVGPEGGFSEQEIQLAMKAKGQLVKLGPRVLRAETAGIVAVTLAQLTWGDLGQ